MQGNIRRKQQAVRAGDFSQEEWMPPSASPVCSLRTLVACLGPRHQMIWRDLLDVYSPWIIFAAVRAHGHWWYCEWRCQPHQELFHSSGCESEGHNNPHCFSSVLMSKKKGLIKSKWVLQITLVAQLVSYRDLAFISFEEWKLLDRPSS